MSFLFFWKLPCKNSTKNLATLTNLACDTFFLLICFLGIGARPQGTVNKKWLQNAHERSVLLLAESLLAESYKDSSVDMSGRGSSGAEFTTGSL